MDRYGVQMQQCLDNGVSGSMHPVPGCSAAIKKLLRSWFVFKVGGRERLGSVKFNLKCGGLVKTNGKMRRNSFMVVHTINYNKVAWTCCEEEAGELLWRVHLECSHQKGDGMFSWAKTNCVGSSVWPSNLTVVHCRLFSECCTACNMFQAQHQTQTLSHRIKSSSVMERMQVQFSLCTVAQRLLRASVLVTITVCFRSLTNLCVWLFFSDKPVFSAGLCESEAPQSVWRTTQQPTAGGVHSGCY